MTDQETFKARDASSYDEAALAYERHIRRLAAPLAEHICTLAGLEPGHSVLDVGTGTGIAARQAASRVGARGHVTGIDLSRGMIEVANRSSRPDRGRLDFRVMDAERIELPDAAVDAVVSLCAALHFPDIRSVLGAMKRVTRPSGRIVVSFGSVRPVRALPLFVHLARRMGRRAAVPIRPSLQAPAAALTVLAEHSIAEERDISPPWTERRPRRRIVEAMREIGLAEIETQWMGHEVLYTDAAEFWEAHVAISTRIRKTFETLDAGRIEELRRDFLDRAEAVLRRGGALSYPYGAVFVSAKVPAG